MQNKPCISEFLISRDMYCKPEAHTDSKNKIGSMIIKMMKFKYKKIEYKRPKNGMRYYKYFRHNYNYHR